MRTTLKIDDDVYQAARSIAAAEHKNIGEVVSSLMRKGLFSKNYSEHVDDIPAFRVSENAPALTPEMVRDADEDSF
ncbi:MAG: antitoxin [Deltaproteobacteria bacterium]|nr:antitoxin [Deltaproteobacteria bacterium]